MVPAVGMVHFTCVWYYYSAHTFQLPESFIFLSNRDMCEEKSASCGVSTIIFFYFPLVIPLNITFIKVSLIVMKISIFADLQIYLFIVMLKIISYITYLIDNA